MSYNRFRVGTGVAPGNVQVISSAPETYQVDRLFFNSKEDSREDLLTKIFTKPQDWLNDIDLEKYCKEKNIYD